MQTIDHRPATGLVSTIVLILLYQNKPAFAADGSPEPSFAAARTFAAPGGLSTSVATGDFNHDGNADLAVGHKHPFDCCAEVVSVLLGTGDGTFTPAVNYYAGLNPVAVAVGDFDGDGNPDLVTANANNTNIFSVLRGNGDGTFQRAISFGAGADPRFVAVGDFDRDGKLDFAAATGSAVSVLSGNGNGMFQAAVPYSAGLNPYSVVIGDFNGDSLSDLAVANYGTTNVSFLAGQDDGTFASAVNYHAGLNPVAIAAGDFNNDGKLDLAVANIGLYYQGSFTNSRVSVLLGKGDGAFQPTVNYYAGLAPVSVAVADFNADGKPDLAVANYGSTNVSVLLGQGDGTFHNAVGFSTGQNPQYSPPQSLAVGDFNGDGRPDLAVAAGNGVVVLLNACINGGIKLAVARTNNALTLSWPLASADFFLESTTNLSSLHWQRSLEPPTTNNGSCEVTVPLDGTQRYFQLLKP